MFVWTTRTILSFGKKSSWHGKTLPKKGAWGKSLFEIMRRSMNSLGYILKSSPILGCSRRGFRFWQINISGNLRRAHVWKSLHFLIFGNFPDDARGFSNLVWALSHSVQEWNIPFGNPSLWSFSDNGSTSATKLSPLGTQNQVLSRFCGLCTKPWRPNVQET